MKRQKTNDLVVIMKYRLGQGFLRFLVRTTFLLDDLTDHDRDHSIKYIARNPGFDRPWGSSVRMVVKLMLPW